MNAEKFNYKVVGLDPGKMAEAIWLWDGLEDDDLADDFSQDEFDDGDFNDDYGEDAFGDLDGEDEESPDDYDEIFWNENTAEQFR